MTNFLTLRQQLTPYFLLILFIFSILLSGCNPGTPTIENKLTAKPTPLPFVDSIIFTSGGDCYQTTLAGDTYDRIPEMGKNVWFPIASPKHQQIAYWSTSSGFNELWLYSATDKQTRQLTYFNEKTSQADLPNYNTHNAPTWTTDGAAIIFSHRGKLWKIDTDGFNLETLIAEDVNASPAVSPDGTLLAYISSQNQRKSLYIRILATGEQWEVTKFPSTHMVGSPAWSANSLYLAFTVSLFEKVDIWSVRKDGAELSRLTRDGLSNSPAWSPDGQKIAFSSGRQDAYHWQIWAMNQDGTGQFSITSKGGFSPTWLRRARDDFSTQITSLPDAVLPQSEKPSATPGVIEKRVTPIPTKKATAKPTPRPTREPTKQPTVIAKQKQPTAVETVEIIELIEVEEGEAPPVSEDDDYEYVMVDENEYAEYEEYADEDSAVLPDEPTKDISSTLDKNKVVFTPEVEFYFAKDMIKPDSLPGLSDLATKLSDYPEASLIVKGYMRGPRVFKKTLPILKTLSRARANSVLRHLIVNEKIQQINVNALGEGDPLSDIGHSDDKVVLVIEVR